MEIVFFALIGIIAGILAGLLGISGGIVTIPLLILVFHKMEIPSNLIMHTAIGTSLASMVFNTLSSSLAHYKKGNILTQISKTLIPACIVGAIGGSYISKNLTSNTLQVCFAIFECSVGLYFFLTAKKMIKENKPLPSRKLLSIIGVAISAFSTLVGIGGGVLLVPTLSIFHIPLKKAIGTSSSVSFFITLTGAISYVIFGIESGISTEGLGFLYLPAFITISALSFIAAPYGAKLSSVIPSYLLKRVFACFLVVTGVLMLAKTF